MVGSRSLFRLGLIPLVGLTTLEIALYHSVDFIGRVWGDIVAVSAVGFGLMTFDLLTAVYVARSFAERRLRYGIMLSALVWGLQLPVIIALVWISEGPPVLADDSLWNVGVFGWWYTGILSIPLIGLLSPGLGWIVDKRKTGHGSERQPTRRAGRTTP